MADTWAAQWAGQWAAGAQRFNHVHAPAGSATGGQFAASSGSGGAKGSKGAEASPCPNRNQEPISGPMTVERCSGFPMRTDA